MLYALDLARGNPGGGAAKVEEVFQGVCENFELPEGARAFAKELVTGVTAQGPALDAEIARHAQRWRDDERFEVVTAPPPLGPAIGPVQARAGPSRARPGPRRRLCSRRSRLHAQGPARRRRW